MFHRQLRGVVTLVVAAALAVGSVGCASGAKDWVEVSTGKLTVDRPANWSTKMQVTKPWTDGYRLSKDSVEQMQLSGDFGEYTTAREAVGTLEGKARLGGVQGFKIVEKRDVKIKGATTATLTRYTITNNNGDPVNGEWIVAVRWPYPQSVAVSILSPQYNQDLERHVLDTMELHPSQ
ncbi:hypothetical protein FOE78_12430 [Microlunatus elymi]|uniref:Lipoprotein n=1 Tax=Microlunatus elymi TaxID=2596828 RepID=A0A516PZK1_9ACTN|nr:hypothetical protein [Microlunatus elymi]QDP96609.1 hypothetical protein FOE78_12430 [Microlunatus elymi]